VGGLAGYNGPSAQSSLTGGGSGAQTISGSTAYSSVYGADYVGGLVGDNEAQVSGSNAYGDVSYQQGTSHHGSLDGYDTTLPTDSTGNGTVTAHP
jgi:hypothetical protein